MVDRGPPGRPGTSGPDLPPPRRPPAEVAADAVALGKRLLGALGEFALRGQFLSAEDAGYRCLSLAYLAANERLKAMTYSSWRG